MFFLMLKMQNYTIHFHNQAKEYHLRSERNLQHQRTQPRFPITAHEKVPLSVIHTFFLYSNVVLYRTQIANFIHVKPQFSSMYNTPPVFFPFFTKINCIYRLNMILLHFPKANYVKSRYTEQPLAYLFFSSKTSSLTMRAIRVPHGRTSLADKKTTQALET